MFTVVTADGEVVHRLVDIDERKARARKSQFSSEGDEEKRRGRRTVQPFDAANVRPTLSVVRPLVTRKIKLVPHCFHIVENAENQLVSTFTQQKREDALCPPLGRSSPIGYGGEIGSKAWIMSNLPPTKVQKCSFWLFRRLRRQFRPLSPPLRRLGEEKRQCTYSRSTESPKLTTLLPLNTSKLPYSSSVNPPTFLILLLRIRSIQLTASHAGRPSGRGRQVFWV